MCHMFAFLILSTLFPCSLKMYTFFENIKDSPFLFRAYAGDADGSLYLQAFATFLKENYVTRPLDRIYLMVKQAMIKAEQV